MTQYIDLNGNWRKEAAFASSSPCAGCGMPVHTAEYHPFIACQMFKQTRDGDSVRANLTAVFMFGYRRGERAAKRKRVK